MHFCLELLSKITRATPVIISNESKANSLNNQFAFVLLDVSWTKTILYEGLYGRMSITQSKKGYSSSFNASNDAIYKHIPQFSNTYWCFFGSVFPTTFLALNQKNPKFSTMDVVFQISTFLLTTISVYHRKIRRLSMPQIDALGGSPLLDTFQ